MSGRSGTRTPKVHSVAAGAAGVRRRTYVPDPTRRSTNPWSCKSRTARPTVIRDAPKRSTSAASLGTRAPAASRPDSISSRKASKTTWYFGTATALRCIARML